MEGESIEGGFYLKARKVKGSAIAKAPPHIREIWDWILMNANFRDREKLKRGQLFATYDMIIEDLSWQVGYRKVGYKKHHCETAMKTLTKLAMITTTKTARGMVITVLNYDKYQDPENYDNHDDNHDDNRNDRYTITALKQKKVINKKTTLAQNDASTPDLAEDRFEMFWAAYPRKVSKKRALEAWVKKGCGNGIFDTVMAKLEEYKASDQWTRDDGRFIPHPTTWINGERWNDILSCPIKGIKVGGLTFE